MNISDQLKQAIEGSGLTVYRIAKDSGVSHPVIMRFLSGERDIRMETAARLCDYLGLRLTSRPMPQKKAAKKKVRK